MDNKKGGAAKKLRILILIVILLCAAIYALSDFLIDWMWFDEMGYVSVFFTELFTKLKLGGPMFAATTLIALLFLMTMKKRFLKKNEMTIDDKSSKRSIRLAGIGLSVFFGVLTTLRIISKLWFQILQLMNATEFGVTDPLFGNDVSFYVFKLEFWEEVCSSLTGLL
ncbi:MAG: UPF0182 family protein, partial [Firmicutes bacterium]|nr:UPF0182 family protein [Bacillota bacterium]